MVLFGTSSKIAGQNSARVYSGSFSDVIGAGMFTVPHGLTVALRIRVAHVLHIMSLNKGEIEVKVSPINRRNLESILIATNIKLQQLRSGITNKLNNSLNTRRTCEGK
jgi:hypothetical protein